MPEFHLDTSLDPERWAALSDFTKSARPAFTILPTRRSTRSKLTALRSKRRLPRGCGRRTLGTSRTRSCGLGTTSGSHETIMARASGIAA
jgi:hypothetical protein